MSQTAPENPQAPAVAPAPFPRRSLPARLLRDWWPTLLVLAAVVGALFAAPPAYRKFRDWRIDRQLGQAIAARDAGDWGTARMYSRAVLQARGGDFEAYRIYAAAQMELKDPTAFMLVLGLLRHESVSPEESFAIRRFLVEEAPRAIAFGVLGSLPEEEQEEPRNRYLMARLLNLCGRFEEAGTLLGKVPELTEDPDLRLEMVRSLIARPQPARMERARAIAASLLDAAAPQALEALVILSEAPGGLAPGPGYDDLPAKVETISGASVIHRLFALHPALEAGDPAARQAIFQDAIDRFLAADSPTLGSWLVRHGEAARIIDLLAPAAETDGHAFLARIHALIRENRLDDAAAAFGSIPDGADTLETAIAQAALEYSRGNKPAERAAWDQALREAAFHGSRNRFIEIARFAAAAGNRPVVADAWAGAVRLGHGPLPLCEDASIQDTFVLLALQNRSEELLAMSRSLVRFEPLNPQLINNVNYLGVLHGTVAAKQASAELARLVEKHPDIPGIRSSLAMARLAAGEPREALEILDGPVEGGQETLRAMRAAALVSAGEEEEGRTLLAGVDWRKMFRQEALFLRDLLVRSRVQDLPLPEINTDLFESDPESVPAWKNALRLLEENRNLETLPELPGGFPMEPSRPVESERSLPRED